MKRLLCTLLVSGILLSLNACSFRRERTSSFFLMDTTVSVTLYEVTEKEADEVFAHSRTLLTELDRLWAREKEGSDPARFNQSATGITDADPRTLSMMQTGLAVFEATEGAFSMTLAPLSDLWKICGQENRLPDETALNDAKERALLDVSLTNTSIIKEDARAQLDFGGIGKGAAIEILLTYLNQTGVPGGLVSFGSNVAVFGEKPDGSPFRIDIRDPKDASGTIGVLNLESGWILSVSGDYERFVTIGGQKYHHIIDPETGYPSDSGLSCVALISRSGAEADALSTALLVLGEERALDLYETGRFTFEAILISSDGTVTTTQGISDSFDLK